MSHDVQRSDASERAPRTIEEYEALLAKARDAEDRWRSIAENPFDFVVIVDLNGTFRFINHAKFGLRVDDLVDHLKVYDFVAPEYHPVVRETIAQVARTHKAGVYEVYAPPPVDNWYQSLVGPIIKNGEVRSVSILAREITAQKRAEMMLRESEERFRQLAENMQDCIYLLDLGTRKTLYASPAAETMFGVPRAEIYTDPRAWLRTVHPEDGPLADACFHAVASGAPSGSRPIEFRVQLADGSLRWLQHRSFVIHDAAGHPIRAAGIVSDVTERAEAQIEQQLARALSQRLVEVQENERRHVARELHDQIGQTLTWLRIHLDMTAQLHGADRDQRLTEAQNLVQELMMHVNDLSLDLRPGILDDLGLREALLWLFDRNARRTGLKVQFEHMHLDGRWARDVETTAFRVVQEALTNAVRHAQVGDVRVRAWVAEETLNLHIEDQGVGFDPARTLDDEKCFGICSMRERVRSHGGELSVDSAPGQGCRITAQIPVLAASIEPEVPGGEG